MKRHNVVFNLVFLTMAFIFLTEAYAYGNNFSCSYGQQGACLDYGDKVCSSTAKCVSGDAVCFDSYTCGFGGFVCKSKLDDLATEYDDLVGQYNDLLRKYKYKLSEYEGLESCVSYASTVEDARNCY